MKRMLTRARFHVADDTGAVLVTVVVVMFVGFIIAATIAASVMFTIGANHENRDRTEAFIAAESGRDEAFESLKAGCTSVSSGATPVAIGTAGESYTYAIQTTDAAFDPANPSALSGLAGVCPGPTTNTIVVDATGYGADGSVIDIRSVYPWIGTPSNSPGGTMAFFDGQFKTTGSGYKGDLVVRTGNYECNNLAVIDGDLWVVGGATGTNGGNVTLSSNCHVTGSIYAAGTVSSSSNPVTVDGDIVARGQISLVSDDLTVGGDVYSGTTVTLTPTGATNASIAGDVISAGDVTGVVDADPVTPVWDDDPADKWDITGQVRKNQPQPTFNPTLAAVFGMTTWIDLGAGTAWSDATHAAVVDTSCPKTVAAFASLLSGSTERLVIDFTGCAGGNNKIDIPLGPAALTRDVLFYVPAGYQMRVSIGGAISSTSTPAPQLWFVHADSIIGDSAPATSCSNKDSFDTGNSLSIRARVLVYSACGLTGTINSDFSGQIYVNADTRTVNANFTCEEMSWEPTLPELNCRISGAGGPGGPVTMTYAIGDMTYQTEK